MRGANQVVSSSAARVKCDTALVHLRSSNAPQPRRYSLYASNDGVTSLAVTSRISWLSPVRIAAIVVRIASIAGIGSERGAVLLIAATTLPSAATANVA